jgi:hypothetical protein
MAGRIHTGPVWLGCGSRALQAASWRRRTTARCRHRARRKRSRAGSCEARRRCWSTVRAGDIRSATHSAPTTIEARHGPLQPRRPAEWAALPSGPVGRRLRRSENGSLTVRRRARRVCACPAMIFVRAGQARGRPLARSAAHSSCTPDCRHASTSSTVRGAPQAAQRRSVFRRRSSSGVDRGASRGMAGAAWVGSDERHEYDNRDECHDEGDRLRGGDARAGRFVVL